MTEMSREELLSRFDSIKELMRDGFEVLNRRLDEFLSRVSEVEREQRDHAKKLVELETAFKHLQNSPPPVPKVIPASIAAGATAIALAAKALWESWSGAGQ